MSESQKELAAWNMDTTIKESVQEPGALKAALFSFWVISNFFIGFLYMFSLTLISRGDMQSAIRNGMLFVLLYNSGRLFVSVSMCRVNLLRYFLFSNILVTSLLCAMSGVLLYSEHTDTVRLLALCAFMLGCTLSYGNIAQRSVTPVVLHKKHNFLFGVLGISGWSIGALMAPLTTTFFTPVLFLLTALAVILASSSLYQFGKRGLINSCARRMGGAKASGEGGSPGWDKTALLLVSLFIAGAVVILFNSSLLPVLRNNLRIEESRISGVYFFLVAGSLFAVLLNKMKLFSACVGSKYFWPAYLMVYSLLIFSINFIFVYALFCAIMFFVGFLTGVFPGVVISYVQENFPEKDYNRVHSLGEFCLVFSGFLFWLANKTLAMPHTYMFAVLFLLICGHLFFVRLRVNT